MNLHYKLLIITIIMLLSGCDSITDVQPEDAEIVPATAAQAIKKRFSNAQNITFSTLIKGKLWNVDFLNSADRMRTVVNDTAIVSDVFIKYEDDFTLIKSLTDKLSIKGGTLSDMRSREGLDNRIVTYTLNGVSYELAYWENDSHYVVTMLLKPESQSNVCQVLSEDDLPAGIRNFFQTNNINLYYSRGLYSVTESGEKKYTIYCRDFEWPTYFDGEGNLRWISVNSAGDGWDLWGPNTAIGKPALLASVSSGFYKDFDWPRNLAFLSTYGQIESVRYSFQRKRGEGSDLVDEIGEVYVNANTGEIVENFYYGYLYK